MRRIASSKLMKLDIPLTTSSDVLPMFNFSDRSNSPLGAMKNLSHGVNAHFNPPTILPPTSVTVSNFLHNIPSPHVTRQIVTNLFLDQRP